jgi:hypothetical protein
VQDDPADGSPTESPSGAAPKAGQTPPNRGKRKRR